MKKVLLAAFLAIFGVLSLIRGVLAAPPADFSYIPYSSYTDVATNGIILFASAPVQFVGVTIGSAAIGSNLVIWRSTSPTFQGVVITTQTFIDTSALNQPPYFVPLFEMDNTSFTYISKAGAAKLTIWLRCQKTGKGDRVRICPGLSVDGGCKTKIELP